MEVDLNKYYKAKFFTHIVPWLLSFFVSLILFIGVVLSGRSSAEPAPIEIVNNLEQVTLPPPPITEPVSPPQAKLSKIPVRIDFHDIPSKETIALLDVKVAPEKNPNLLEDIKFDLNSVEVSVDDFSTNIVYEPTEVDDPPVPIYQPFPMLPNKLKISADQRVRVIFYVNDKGRVDNPYVIESSDPMLNELVLETLRKWKYQPAKKNSQPVSCWVRTSLILRSGKQHSPFGV